MSEVKILGSEKFGRDFIPGQYLPQGKDEYHLRNQQVARPAGYWRKLRADEIAALARNANTCDDWDSFFVSDVFSPHLVKNSEFYGLVRIGRLDNVILEHHELQVPAGITNSRIISCDIGDNAAVHNVRHLSHYIIGNNAILLNIDEMQTSNHAKFGNGIVKDGENEDVRIWLDLMNEAGGRSVMPFEGMIPADAYLWARYREDAALQAKFREITQKQFDPRRGFYGTVGDSCVIKNSQIIKDVKIGPHCYIKGANKLKNLTIQSSADEPTQIGEGVELVNGIVGLNCHIFYGCKAVRFVMGGNSNLKYGARLIHSFLGDNSTVSCCELLNNLIFPCHEQHHNNSFLVAALLMGQSNIAAGATLGSNHNSRANDGELQAGRGFWPGLCTTLKHCCRFASFVLLAKGDYPAELNIPLPFSLLSNDTAADRLLVMPAYWWLYNMYALARNTWKFQARDKRKTKTQHIEADSLAPDTAEEIFAAMRLLEIWTAKAHLRRTGESAASTPAGENPRPTPSQNPPVTTPAALDQRLAAIGRSLLLDSPDKTAGLKILGEGMENTRREAVILKPREGYAAYRQMLHHYAVKNLLAYLAANPGATLASTCSALAAPRQQTWVNLGGQLVPAPDVDRLLADIKSGALAGWPEIHQAYDRLWQEYPLRKQQHALATLHTLLDTQSLTPAAWNTALDQAIAIQELIRDRVYLSRKKDFDDPFRQTTFRNPEEMRAVLGTPEDNNFVAQVRQETEAFRSLAVAARAT
ncbi:MAG: DUF4954 family protein [Tepidisphaeraceae bacterium]|jgi:hypothetical protein